MAVCAVCGGEMLGVDSCRQEPVNFPDGASLSPIAYGHERRITWESARCHDCGVARLLGIKEEKLLAIPKAA